MKLIVDTNVLLHYRSITEIDWLEAFSVPHVEIVLLMPVIHELDEKKNHPTLRERAGRVLREVRQIRDAESLVREGVTLHVDPDEVDPSAVQPPLSMASRDDQIIVLAKQLAAEHESVAVVTDDFGLQVKCDKHAVARLSLPEKYKLKEPKSEYQRKLSRIEAELARYKDRRPKLSLGLSLADAQQVIHRTLEINIDPMAEFDIEEAMEKVRRENPLPSGGGGGQWTILGDDGFISQRQLDVHKRVILEFYDQYENYLGKLKRFKSQARWCVKCRVWLSNTGTLTTRDVDVSLRIPTAGLIVVDEAHRLEDALLRPPAPPDPPEVPSGPFASTWRVANEMQMYEGPSVAESIADYINRNVTDFSVLKCEQDGHVEVTAQVKKVRHSQHVLLGELILVVDDEAPPQGAELAYIISDDVSVDATEGKCALTFRV
ncbi:MAG: PIN domain-containing protein [Phycisphaerales bacterium]